MNDGERALRRRRVLGGVAAGATAGLAGCTVLDREADAPVGDVGDGDGANRTDDVGGDRARELAERFAPTLYFDRNEPWFPTDPRPYASERDGTTVVDGFDALEGYVRAGGHGDPPGPTVFYHVVRYEDSPLAVVQYWFYSVFDQFTTNFHWHDWELLQVFVDLDTGEPQLYVASSHSRKVPNNEHLDPDPDRRPRVLSELGSHSSGLSVNDDEEHFQRLPLGDDVADITNSLVEGIEAVASIPLAYGLPRDEGFALPFAVPELDDAPIHDDDRLPSVGAADLIPDGLSFASFSELRSPPTELPQRETGPRWEHADRDVADADVGYDLVPTAEIEHIADFTGPQLSFQFAIPDFAEDLVASHITTAGVPWQDPRYERPADDISEPGHRQALADRYDAIGDPSPVNRVIAHVTNAITSDDAPEDQGLTTEPSPLELFALIQSDPAAVPTFHGIAAAQDLPAGEHGLAVNGAGVAPHGETVTVEEDGQTVAGVDGEIPVVAREDATKLAVDPRGSDADLTDLAVEDDFAGWLYDAPLDGPDAVYVHRGGAFTAEVRDSDDELGAFRVNPDDEARIRIDEPDTGKTPLARYLADLAEETRDQVAAVASVDADAGSLLDQPDAQGNAVIGLAQALGAVAEAAERAADRAASGDGAGADRQLAAVATRLDRVATRLEDARGALPDGLANAADRRLGQARRRTEQARAARKL